MSGRLVGEVIDWLQTPAADGLTLAERTILIVIAERSNERTRDAWRHRTDEQNLYDRIRKATKLENKGLSSALRRLRDRGLEVRVPIKKGKDGRTIYAHEGMSMRFRLPDLPASVSLPERASGERGSRSSKPVEGPVDNPPEGAPATTESPSEGRGTDLRGPLGRDQRPSHQRALIPLYTSTTNTSRAGGLCDHVAELEGAGPVIVAPTEKNDLASDDDSARYTAARNILSRFADLGAQFMERAQSEIPEATLREMVIRAAQLAAKGIPA